MSSADPSALNQSSGPSKPRRLWPWFVIGFVGVFVGTALCVTMFRMDDSGAGIVSEPLWRYYLAEGWRMHVLSPRSLGPTSGSTEAAFVVLMQHLVISSGGGAILVGIAWAVRRWRGSTFLP